MGRPCPKVGSELDITYFNYSEVQLKFQSYEFYRKNSDNITVKQAQ